MFALNIICVGNLEYRTTSLKQFHFLKFDFSSILLFVFHNVFNKPSFLPTRPLQAKNVGVFYYHDF